MREFVARKTAISAVVAAGLAVAGLAGPASASAPSIPTITTTGIMLNPSTDPNNLDNSFAFYGYADPTVSGGLNGGTLVGPASNVVANGPLSVANQFAFDYQFQLTNAASLASFSFQDNQNFVGISNMNMVLENSTANSVHGSLVSNSCVGCSNDGTSISLNYSNLAAGFYTLEITGVVSNQQINGLSNGGSFSGSVVSAVPVPGAILMFGSGVVGLVAFSRRKRAAAKAG